MFDAVPESWGTTTLRAAAGGLFTDGDWVESKDQDPNGEVRLIQLADIGDGAFLDKSARFLTAEKARELGCTFLQPGDLLIARMADPIARCCIFPGVDQPAATVVDVSIVRPGPQVDRDYLSYAVSSQAFRSEALGAASGTTRSRISRSNLGQIELPLPPLDEQRRIAEVLRAADAAIEAERSYHSQIETVTSLVRERLIWSDASIPMIKLDECVSAMRNGAVYDARSQAGDALVTRIETIADGEIDYGRTGRCQLDTKLSAYRMESGDILFSHINSVKHIGKTAIKRDDRELYHGMNLMLLRANSSVVLPEYLYAVLLTETARAYFREHARVAVNQASLNKKDIGSFEMPCPSTEAQIKIVGQLAALEASARSSSDSLKHMRHVAKAVRFDLLSGRVRVPA